MTHRIGRVLIDRERIAGRVGDIGRELTAALSKDAGADEIVFIPILTGAMVFAADLIRHIPLTLNIRVLTVSSYPGESLRSKGATLRGALPTDLAGKHVVVVDDILDSGQTLALVHRLISEQAPASLRMAVLLRKDVPREAHVDVAHVGFDIPDEFVVGYGLDFGGRHRNLPDVVTLVAE